MKLQGKDRNINDHSVYNTTDLDYKFNTGLLKHDVIAGIDLSHETYSNQSLHRRPPRASRRTRSRSCRSLDPPYTPRPATTQAVATNLAESSANGIGIYANDTVSLGQHWKVIGGLRWDRFQAQIHNTINLPSLRESDQLLHQRARAA